jgi:hypothetical protein
VRRRRPSTGWGAQVWATDINEAGPTEAEGGPQLHRRKLNALDAATISALFAEIGRVTGCSTAPE